MSGASARRRWKRAQSPHGDRETWRRGGDPSHRVGHGPDAPLVDRTEKLQGDVKILGRHPDDAGGDGSEVLHFVRQSCADVVGQQHRDEGPDDG